MSVMPHTAVAVSWAANTPRGKSRPTGLSFNASCGGRAHVLSSLTALPSFSSAPDAGRSCCSSACDPRSATKSLPCAPAAGYPPWRVPLLMTTPTEVPDKTCADHSAFSSISRSRSPNADRCVSGPRLFFRASQSGLCPARC